MGKPIAIIGGGLTGLASALRLAERGERVHLFESAPALGGRTRSHFDKQVDEWVDNGPHLLIGAYHTTRQLMRDIDAEKHITWQPSLQLPLFDAARGHFALTPKAWLPFPVALLSSLYQMPGHGLASIKSMLTLASAMKSPSGSTVAAWLKTSHINQSLIQDMVEPLCIGAMNEAMEDADVETFARVMRETFANHDAARLGWFNQPLTQALIEPLEKRLKELGVRIFTTTTVQRVQQVQKSGSSDKGGCILHTQTGATEPYAYVVLALPAYARDRLLGMESRAATSPITNVHLWFDASVGNIIQLPEPLIGSINTRSQWFFDISRQTAPPSTSEQREKGRSLSHICAVISAETPGDREHLTSLIMEELTQVCGEALPPPVHSKIICEQRATVLVDRENQRYANSTILDACEAPQPGELPATIEAAIRRGETAADTLYTNKNSRLSTEF